MLLRLDDSRFPFAEAGAFMAESAIDRLARMCGREWPHLANALTEAAEVRGAIRSAIASELGRIDSDLDVVVFGSLARGEWTSGSDVDWTLLVDGQASPNHRKYLTRITECIKSVRHRGKTLPDPGQTGTFASITFSHDIIHLIGGDTDTNKNTTRRILLLLESAPIRSDDDQNTAAYGRVVKGVIERYLQNDSNVSNPRSVERFPHFLLNDIVRYWRTVCVDFAWKEWEQPPEKWALRNIKLRISRKLLFVSGMLAVFSCWQAVQADDLPVTREDMFDRLQKAVQASPLEVTVAILQDLGLPNEAALLLDVYDTFLEHLNDPATRPHFESLAPAEAFTDEAFIRMKELSDRFQEVLVRIFFDLDTPLRDFNRKHGVF